MKKIDNYFAKATNRRVKIETEAVNEQKVSEEKACVNEEKNHDDTKNHNDDQSMSEYEKVRIENIRRNEEFLVSLGLDTHKVPNLVVKQGSLSKVLLMLFLLHLLFILCCYC